MATSNLISAILRKRNAVLAAMMTLMLLMTVAAQAQRQTSFNFTAQAQVIEKHRVIPVPNPRDLDASIWVDQPSYRNGEAIKINFKVSDDAYVYIFDTDTDGVTRQIFPNYWDRSNFIRGGKTVSLPNRDYSLVVSGPTGREKLEIIAVTEDSPDFAEYKSFGRDNPYPTRRGGVEGMMNRVETRVKMKSGKGSSAVIRSERIDVGPKRIDARPNGIEVIGHEEPVLYARDTTSFMVRAREHRPLLGRLRIDSDPDEARIYIDGEYMAKTPETITLPFGRHDLRIRKNGYRDAILSVDINHSGRDRVDVRLRREWGN